MVTLDRWQAAQEYERGYWQGQADQIATGSLSQLEWYGWRADQLKSRLEGLGLGSLADGKAEVLEVGCGPIGIASYFPARSRVAVDPLEDFYRSNEVLSALRNSEVSYRTGVGEKLPVEGGGFDLVIIENCIDHVQDVDAVMRELKRSLRPGGIVYLTVNNRTKWGYVVHRLLSRMRVDAGHPHTFTPPRVRGMFERNGYQILGFEAGSYMEALREDLALPQLRAKAKAMLGTSEFLVTVFARSV